MAVFRRPLWLTPRVIKAALDDRLIDAYEAKYDSRPTSTGYESGPWYRLRPRIAYAWLERDYPRTVTRFDFTLADER